MKDAPWGSLEYYLPPYDYGWRVEHPPQPHEVVAWRKMRKGRWIAWSYYTRYSWANIRKWVTKRGDVYQVATANGQVCTVKRRKAEGTEAAQVETTPPG